LYFTADADILFDKKQERLILYPYEKKKRTIGLTNMVMEKAKDYPEPVPAFMQTGSSPTPDASLNFDTDG
jgi:hypothetical protein